jgi:hypothetical protein
MKQHQALIFAGANGSIFAGVHVVDEAEAAAGTCSFSIGASRIMGQALQILRDGSMVTDDVRIDNSNALLTVSNGVAYELAAGDLINFVALGA